MAKKRKRRREADVLLHLGQAPPRVGVTHVHLDPRNIVVLNKTHVDPGDPAHAVVDLVVVDPRDLVPEVEACVRDAQRDDFARLTLVHGADIAPDVRRALGGRRVRRWALPGLDESEAGATKVRLRRSPGTGRSARG
jgi:hypothetical protein